MCLYVWLLHTSCEDLHKSQPRLYFMTKCATKHYHSASISSSGLWVDVSNQQLNSGDMPRAWTTGYWNLKISLMQQTALEPWSMWESQKHCKWCFESFVIRVIWFVVLCEIWLLKIFLPVYSGNPNFSADPWMKNTRAADARLLVAALRYIICSTMQWHCC